MKVAIIHDWLTGMRGGEAVLEAMIDAVAETFLPGPGDVEIFTLLHVPGSVSSKIESFPIRTSWLQKVPEAERRYRHFLPFMPSMIESLDLSGFDLIVSSSHCVAKGVRKPAGAVHVSYVHAPMRYMWDRFEDYFGAGRASLPVRLAAWAVRPYLQAWDRRTAARVDHIVANSRFISEQIERAWGRESRVVYPFVAYERFQRCLRAPENFYLMVGAFAPNKRVDLAVEAFNALKLPLKIVGGGQDEKRLRKMAAPTIEFLGSCSHTEIEELYSKCRAFVFPGVEDFGITPLEAMAAGAPVIALGRGGACETVVAGETGIFFTPQTVDALSEAVKKVERGEASFDPEACRARAREFSRERFLREFGGILREAITPTKPSRQTSEVVPRTHASQDA